MKFGEYLSSQKNKEWESNYLDYESLKKLIKILEEKNLETNPSTPMGKGMSLSVILYDERVAL